MSAMIRSNGLLRNLRQSIRLLSTSQKKSDTTVAQPAVEKSEDTIDFSIEGVKKSKTWVSYGFDYENEEYDRQVMRNQMFIWISVFLVFGGFYLAYFPDLRQRDWTSREAYLRLREREAAVLVAVSPDFVDASQITLPTDEELGDREIII